MKAYDQGLVSEEDIRTAAVRLFTTRFILGMFDETEFDGLNYLDVETKENLAVAKRASDESIVLLKNDGILPIDKNKNKVIAVIGPNADSRACLIGNYYGTSSEYITALEGIRNAAGDDTRILYSEGCDICQVKPDNLSREYHRIAEAKAVMNRADLVVLVIGLNENLEGEEGDQGNHYRSGDKPDLLFPKTQRKLIDTVIASGKPFITVVMAGSAMDLSVLPLYPFGYGLTYGKMDIVSVDYTGDDPKNNGLKIKAELSNTGDITTSEVIQVYLKAEEDANEVKNTRLAAFTRAALGAGEKTSVEIDIPAERLKVVNDKGERVIPEGKITVYVGFGQPDALTERLSGRKSLSFTI